jgi:hypothetical protein
MPFFFMDLADVLLLFIIVSIKHSQWHTLVDKSGWKVTHGQNRIFIPVFGTGDFRYCVRGVECGAGAAKLLLW